MGRATQFYLGVAGADANFLYTGVSLLCLGCVNLASNKRGNKRVQVSFTAGQWNLIECFKGIMGDSDADIVRNIVLAWLAEKSFITYDIKQRMKAEAK